MHDSLILTYHKLDIIALRYSMNDEKTVKLLGVGWKCESDDLLFYLSDLIDFAKDFPVSKRSLLKLTAKIFDPLECYIQL